jgi:hypothetical protein
MDIMDCNADIFNNGSFLELSGGMILALMPREVIMQPTTLVSSPDVLVAACNDLDTRHVVVHGTITNAAR